MPRRPSIPRYCLHKRSGQAVVFVNRTQRYLGPYNSPESREAYGELVSKLAKGVPIENAEPASSTAGISVSDLLLKYVTEKLPRYANAEQHCQRSAIRILRQLFGETAAAEFGPLKLGIVRDAMVAGDPLAVDADGNPKPRKSWSRGFVNDQIRRLRSVFRWGVAKQLVTESVLTSLKTLAGLNPGDSEAHDYEPRHAVPQEDLQAVRAILTDLHRDIFDLLLLTGARAGEVIGLRIGDVNRTGDVWRADLKQHKTAHKGKKRTLYFNIVARSILLRHMKTDPDERFFPIRRDNYGAAIKRACIKANVPPFTPHWLRHTVATLLADEMGTEAAQRLLGHAAAAMTEHYSKAAERLAMKAAERLGIVG